MLPFWQQLKFNVFRRESGYLFWRTEEGKTVRQLTFFNAACTTLTFDLDATGQQKDAATQLRLRLSPAAIELQGIYVELYSRLSWEKDAAVRRRALLQPSELRLLQSMPSAISPAMRQDVFNKPEQLRLLSSVTRAAFHQLGPESGIASIELPLSDAEYNKTWDSDLPAELYNFDLEELMHHVEYRDYTVKRKNGIGGAHNVAEWNKHGADYVETSRAPHPTVLGVEKVEYKIHALNTKGKPSGEFVAFTYRKTVYDATYWTRPRLERALKEAILSARIKNGGTLLDGEWWDGTTAQGDVIRGTYRKGHINTFFFA